MEADDQEIGHWEFDADALASYAKQSGDETLYKAAMRIRDRAIRRCGELLKQIGLPKSQHAKAKRALQEIWMAETKTDANTAIDAFIETYEVKYDKVAECLNR